MQSSKSSNQIGMEDSKEDPDRNQDKSQSQSRKSSKSSESSDRPPRFRFDESDEDETSPVEDYAANFNSSRYWKLLED